MTDWNFNIAEAPRGREVTAGKGTRIIPVPILAAYPDNKTVAKTRWLPDAERWEGMTKDQAPVAWKPWDTHPFAEDDQ